MIFVFRKQDIANAILHESLLSDSVGGIARFQKYIVAVSRSDGKTYRQTTYPIPQYLVLFHLNFATFGAFLHNRFDFLFSYFTIGRGFDIENFDE